MKKTLLILSTLLTLSLSAITIGEIPKQVTIDGDNGGLVADGGVFDTATIKDKVLVMFYVDPDEKDTNSHFTKILKSKKYDRANYGSIAVVNLAATWKPNFIIEKLLKSKQEEFPDTIYVKDKKSLLVNEWKVADDASNVLIFAKSGELLFYKSGAMSKEDIKIALELIESNL
jgi:predicted transcriptional regulator